MFCLQQPACQGRSKGDKKTRLHKQTLVISRGAAPPSGRQEACSRVGAESSSLAPDPCLYCRKQRADLVRSAALRDLEL